MADNAKKWYVLRAISGKENQAKDYLEKECKADTDFARYIGQVLIPTEKVMTMTPKGKKVVKERYYLPGYVLVEAELTDAIARRLSNTPNIIGFLSDDPAHPTPLRKSEVNRILGQVDEAEEVINNTSIPFAVGDAVKVTYGAFSGFSGHVEEVLAEKRKVKVMVMIFGRKTPVELGFTQVEKE